jgi:superfamily I DNA/RNA helicase
MAVRLFLKEYGIAVDQKVYAKLSELSDKLNHQPASYNVKSIDAIKGLEAETCIFILSKTSLDYFLQDDLAKEKRFNKEWKRVYVALTRSQDALHLVLDHTILAKEDVHRAKCAFQKYGIDKHACNP